MTWARVAIAAAALAAGCGAATETSGSFDDVRALLDAGGDVDWYVSSRIVFPEALAVSAQALRVFGSGGAALDGGGAAQLFAVDGGHLAVSGAALERARAASGGAAALGGNSTATFADCAFRDVAADGWGGAVFADGGAVVVANCSFARCAANLGGAVALAGGASAAISGSRFSNNSAASAGGALATSLAGPVAVDATVFESNAAMLGGAVSLDRTPIDTVAVNCAFADNFAHYGGAVAVAVSGTFAAAASTFDGNAAAFGAAFALYEAAAEPVVTVRLDNDTRVRNNRASLCGGAAMVIQRLAGTVFDGGGAAFVDNGSDGDGGAFCVLGGAVHDGTIANVAISGSSAGAKGGAVFVNDDSGVSLANVTSDGNGARDGALVYVSARSAVALAGVVSRNDVADVAGVVYVERASVLDADDLRVSDATTGSGAVVVDEAERVAVRNATFARCARSDRGLTTTAGAIYGAVFDVFDAGDVSLRDVSVSESRGGPAFRAAAAVVDLDNVVVADAQGDTGAALHLTDRTRVTLRGCTFEDNAATVHGGAAALFGASKIVSRGANGFWGNDAGGRGGAFYLAEASEVKARHDAVAEAPAPSKGRSRNSAGRGGDFAWVDATTVGSVDVLRAWPGGNATGALATGVASVAATYGGTSEKPGWPFGASLTLSFVDLFGEPILGVQAYASFTTVGNATFVQSNKRVLGDAPSVSWSPSQGDQMAVIAEYGSPSVALRGELIVDDAGDAYDSTTTTLTADVVVALDPCFPGETLVEASQHCEPCAAGTYWRGASLGAWDAGGACHECPRGFYCEAEGLALGDLRVESGWFRFEASAEVAYRCASGHDGCAGVRNGTGDEALCADGYVGAVCGACERRHVASVDSRARLACAGCRLDVSWEVAVALFGGAFLAFLGALLWLLLSPRGEELLLLFFDTRGGAADDVTGMLHLDKNTPAPANEHDRKKQKFAALVVKAKALSSFFQLIASFQEAFGSGLQFPKTYASMQNAFSFATLGFFAYLPTRCFYDSSPAAHYVHGMLGATLFPVFLALVIVACAYVKGWSEEQRKKRGHFFFSAFLIMIHLALPSCAFTAVQTLVCDDFDAGDDGDVYFLRVAPTISCEGSLWRAVIRPYGILMIFVYPLGVPLMYASLLLPAREALNPTTKAEEELDSTFDTDLDMDKRQMLRLSSSFQRQCSTLRMEAFENDDPDGILAFKFLWIDYEPRCFWWELVEVTKRVFFCAFLSIVQYGSKLQIFVALCASILYEAMLHQFEPFVFDEDDAIALTACWSILVTLLLSCMLRVGVLSPSAWYATALLIGAALAPIFVVIYVVRRAYRAAAAAAADPKIGDASADEAKDEDPAPNAGPRLSRGPPPPPLYEAASPPPSPPLYADTSLELEAPQEPGLLARAAFFTCACDDRHREPAGMSPRPGSPLGRPLSPPVKGRQVANGFAMRPLEFQGPPFLEARPGRPLESPPVRGRTILTGFLDLNLSKGGRVDVTGYDKNEGPGGGDKPLAPRDYYT